MQLAQNAHVTSEAGDPVPQAMRACTVYRGRADGGEGWTPTGLGSTTAARRRTTPSPMTATPRHLTARAHAQRLNPKTRTPAPTRRMPAHSRGVGRSWRNRWQRRHQQRLSLSRGDFDASPICKARSSRPTTLPSQSRTTPRRARSFRAARTGHPFPRDPDKPCE